MKRIAILVVGLTACTSPTRQAPAESRPVLEAHPQPAPTAASVAPRSAEPETPLASPTDRVADQLAELWCALGGDTFSAPGSANPDVQALTSCSDVARSTLATEDLASIVGLSVPTNEDSRWLHLSKSNQALLLTKAWSSGVGGFSHEVEATPPVVADVYGDAEPEVWTFVTTGWNDTDMGVCHRAGMRSERLVLCTTSGGVACFDLPFVQFEYDEIYSEPGSDCAPPKRKATGYGLQVSIGKNKVTLTPTGQQAFRWTHSKPPPFANTVAMSDLFAKAPAKILSLP